ncbi:nucleoid-associated protein [Niameybacter massiliensis]|uniref:Nucleoid-associated protein n=1 Tax=Holtiella tumoricola TaxID=3018743 RepID=A0AA42DM94_9FIRM|nr:nucleoid-associated protein [Holtiella tumoricola]MDA3731640.1 nucleoid-associated protein [Holtiella tumoricola]
MSILFDKVIMHTLDMGYGQPILSKECLALNDEVEAYITTYIVDLFNSHSVSHAIFEETSSWAETIRVNVPDFYSFSCELASQFFAYMQTLENIPNGDLIVTRFKRDQVPYIAFFKLNYKEAYTHVIDQNGTGTINQIIKHKTIFPETSSKIQEAAIINLETCEILLLDGHKECYLHNLLGTTTTLSTKQKIKLVEQVITGAIEENFDNKLEGLAFAKTNIAKSIDHTSSIRVSDVLEETFGEHEHIKEQCLSIFEEQGIAEEVIEIPNAEKVGKKYTSHKIKTNTGIEIKLPTEMLTDPNKFEVVNNPDGSVEVRLKNIGALINK